MTCQHCTAATAGPHFGFNTGCKACMARDLARGPDFHRCRAAGKQDKPYRALLAHRGVTHEEVVRASEADKERAPA